MSQLLLSRSPYRQELASSKAAAPRRSRIATMKLHFEFGPTALIVGLMILVVFMSVLYLMHFNEVATTGYDLTRLQMNLQQLTDVSQVNNIDIARAKSLQSILNSPRVATMVKANSFIYVSGNTAIAKADEGS